MKLLCGSIRRKWLGVDTADAKQLLDMKPITESETLPQIELEKLERILRNLWPKKLKETQKVCTPIYAQQNQN